MVSKHSAVYLIYNKIEDKKRELVISGFVNIRKVDMVCIVYIVYIVILVVSVLLRHVHYVSKPSGCLIWRAG